MKVKKGTKLTISDSRKGVYHAVATASFDTEEDEWYSVAVDQDETVRGIVTDWCKGDGIPCRRGQCTVMKRAKKNGRV